MVNNIVVSTFNIYEPRANAPHNESELNSDDFLLLYVSAPSLNAVTAYLRYMPESKHRHECEDNPQIIITKYYLNTE